MPRRRAARSIAEGHQGGKAATERHAPATLQTRTRRYAPATLQARAMAMVECAMRKGGALRGGNPDRRRFCAAGAAALFALAARPAAAETYQEDRERQVPIRNLWTGERRNLVYWRAGAYDGRALLAYSHLLRDRRDGKYVEIFYGVLDQLFFLWKALDRPGAIDLVSGYRSDRSNAYLHVTTEGVARNSLHTMGMAADVRVDGIESEAVWRAAVDLRRGGAGLYRASDFVHIDVGPVRSWVY